MVDSNDTQEKFQQNHLNYSNLRIIIITVFLSFSLFTAWTGEGIIIPVFPLYLTSFGAGAFQLGILIGVYSLTSLLLAPFIGSLADKNGRKMFIIFGLLAFSIANVLYSMAQSFTELLIFRILEGSAAASIAPIVSAMVIDIIPETKRGKYLGLVNGSAFLGIIIGPFLGGVLVQNGNYSLPFQFSALIAFIGSICALIILPNDYSYFRAKNKVKIEKKLKISEKINYRNWIIEGTSALFLIVLFIRFTGLTAWELIEPSITFYLYSLHYEPFLVGLYFSTYGISMFFGQIFLGGLSDKYGRKLILQIGLGLYLVGFCFIVNAVQISYFFIFGIFNGIGLSLVIPAIVAMLADLTNKEENRGKVMGFYYGVFYLSGIAGPIVGGYLADAFSFSFVVLISIIILAAGFLSSFKLKSTILSFISVKNNKVANTT